MPLISAMRDYLAGFAWPVSDFLSGFDWRLEARELPPRTLAAARHLDRVAAIAGGSRLVERLVEDRPALSWGQTYGEADFGRRFVENYCWVEMIGTRGHFVCDRLAAGFLILGPELHYPDHRHVAEEIYIPLTGGAEWRMGDEPFTVRPAGAAIHHRSNVVHAMKTGAEPLLALYLWRGGPLDQRSTIAGREG